MSRNRPRWRWWLCYSALWLYFVTPPKSRLGRVASAVFGWAVLPEWLGVDGKPLPMDEGGEEYPF